MIPDPSTTETPICEGGSGQPAGDERTTPRPRPGHIPCVICTDTISLDHYRQARCWTDPHGITCAAHSSCLLRLGEFDLDLPPSSP